MWRLLLGTMGVKSLVQGLNAAATAGFEPRTVWSEVRRRNRLATAPPQIERCIKYLLSGHAVEVVANTRPQHGQLLAQTRKEIKTNQSNAKKWKGQREKEKKGMGSKPLAETKNKPTNVPLATAWCNEIGSLTSLMHVTQVHPVTTENQFHCTWLYMVDEYNNHLLAMVAESNDGVSPYSTNVIDYCSVTVDWPNTDLKQRFSDSAVYMTSTALSNSWQTNTHGHTHQKHMGRMIYVDKSL